MKHETIKTQETYFREWLGNRGGKKKLKKKKKQNQNSKQQQKT